MIRKKWIDLLSKKEKYEKIGKLIWRKKIFSYTFYVNDAWSKYDIKSGDLLEVEMELYKFIDLSTPGWKGILYTASCPNHSTHGFRKKNDAIAELLYLTMTDGVPLMRLKERLESRNLHNKLV